MYNNCRVSSSHTISSPGVAQLVGRLVWELVVSPLFRDAKSEETREKRSICEYSRVCKTRKIDLTTYLTRTAKSSFSHSFYKNLISGCGPVGRALDLGSRRREFESPHSDQQKRLFSQEISRFSNFLYNFSVHRSRPDHILHFHIYPHSPNIYSSQIQQFRYLHVFSQ